MALNLDRCFRLKLPFADLGLLAMTTTEAFKKEQAAEQLPCVERNAHERKEVKEKGNT